MSEVYNIIDTLNMFIREHDKSLSKFCNALSENIEAETLHSAEYNNIDLDTLNLLPNLIANIENKPFLEGSDDLQTLFYAIAAASECGYFEQNDSQKIAESFLDLAEQYHTCVQYNISTGQLEEFCVS